MWIPCGLTGGPCGLPVIGALLIVSCWSPHALLVVVGVVVLVVVLLYHFLWNYTIIVLRNPQNRIGNYEGPATTLSMRRQNRCS